jgi:hypothetical protein
MAVFEIKVILIVSYKSPELLPLRGFKRRQQLATFFDSCCSQMIGYLNWDPSRVTRFHLK